MLFSGIDSIWRQYFLQKIRFMDDKAYLMKKIEFLALRDEIESLNKESEKKSKSGDDGAEKKNP